MATFEDIILLENTRYDQYIRSTSVNLFSNCWEDNRYQFDLIHVPFDDPKFRFFRICCEGFLIHHGLSGGDSHKQVAVSIMA